MAKSDFIEVEGFNELKQKIKKLDDKTTRREVLKIQRQMAKPAIEAYKRELPVDGGTLAKSVKAVTTPARKSGGNPSIAVRPGKKGKADAYYKFMVIRKGDQPGSRKRGSRKGLNTVVEDARNKALSVMDSLKQNYVDKTAKYIQKQINKLS